jgi:uncharacterized membrane protein
MEIVIAICISILIGSITTLVIVKRKFDKKHMDRKLDRTIHALLLKK